MIKIEENIYHRRWHRLESEPVFSILRASLPLSAGKPVKQFWFRFYSSVSVIQKGVWIIGRYQFLWSNWWFDTSCQLNWLFIWILFAWIEASKNQSGFSSRDLSTSDLRCITPDVVVWMTFLQSNNETNNSHCFLLHSSFVSIAEHSSFMKAKHYIIITVFSK